MLKVISGLIGAAFLLTALLLWPSPGAVQAARQRTLIDLPVEMMVPIAPTPVEGDGKTHLAYELHLTNFAPLELTLVRLEVLGGDGKPLAEYQRIRVSVSKKNSRPPPLKPDAVLVPEAKSLAAMPPA